MVTGGDEAESFGSSPLPYPHERPSMRLAGALLLSALLGCDGSLGNPTRELELGFEPAVERLVE